MTRNTAIIDDLKPNIPKEVINKWLTDISRPRSTNDTCLILAYDTINS